jgi:hypothetical protein
LSAALPWNDPNGPFREPVGPAIRTITLSP